MLKAHKYEQFAGSDEQNPDIYQQKAHKYERFAGLDEQKAHNYQQKASQKYLFTYPKE